MGFKLSIALSPYSSSCSTIMSPALAILRDVAFLCIEAIMLFVSYLTVTVGFARSWPSTIVLACRGH